MNVVWSEEAIESAKTIRRRLASFSQRAADDFEAALRRRQRQLEQFPTSGRMVPEYGTPLIRELIEGPYRIVYEHFPDRIEILVIRHGREHFER